MECPRLLILDDDPGVVAAVSRELAQGFDGEVVGSTDPDTALRRLPEGFSVFLCDFHMPGSNGAEVLARAAEIAPETVRILLTGRADRDQVVAAVNTGGIFRYLAKPWSADDLLQAVSEGVAVHEASRRRGEALHAALEERESLQAAIAVASDLQRALFPAGPIPLSGAEAACTFTICEHATGDYVDVLALDDGRSAFVIGDVSGHGLGAALFVFTARALLKSAIQEGDSLEAVFRRTNRFLCRDMTHGRFMTLFVGIFDPRSGTLRYLNAGHAAPVLLDSEGPRELSCTSLPLGIFPDSDYANPGTVRLGPSATLFAYTDGAVESRDAAGRLFGKMRLLTALAEHAGEAPRDLLERVREEVKGFRAASEDDLTLLAVRTSPAARKPTVDTTGEDASLLPAG